MTTLATWDIFHSERLEVERNLTTSEVRARLDRGDLGGDDLIRPADGSASWARLADLPVLAEEEPKPAPASSPPTAGSIDQEETPAASHPDEPVPVFLDDFLNEDEDDIPAEDDEASEHPAIVPQEVPPQSPGAASVDDALDLRGEDDPEWPGDGQTGWDENPGGIEPYDPQEEDEAAAEFTLSRGSADRVEELDLAAMVDVAFQLVLFFLVTASTIIYKSLEIPKPNPEDNPAAAVPQGKPKTLEDLQKDFIVVEIDPAGALKVDREPVPAERSALIEKLRVLREQTHRSSMLLTADFSTPHRSAVLAYDAANEIGLGIAIARPLPGGNPTGPTAPAGGG